MKFKLKKDGNHVIGARLDCSVVETLTIISALRTQLLANKTLYKDYTKLERDNKVIEKMIKEMEKKE